MGFLEGEEWVIRPVGQALRTADGSSVRAGRSQGVSGLRDRTFPTIPHHRAGEIEERGMDFQTSEREARSCGHHHGLKKG